MALMCGRVVVEALPEALVGSISPSVSVESVACVCAANRHYLVRCCYQYSHIIF